jgi:hypothetical protein
MRIDSGPLEPTYLFRDTPRSEWSALLQQKRLFLARNLNYDCSKLLEFCEEAEQVWQDLGFASYVAMIRDGFDLVPDEIAIARKWLELNKPEWVIPLPDVRLASSLMSWAILILMPVANFTHRAMSGLRSCEQWTR